MADSERALQEQAKGALRAELKRRNVSYEEVASRLRHMGAQHIEPVNLINKVSRGTFSASFFLQCLGALDVRILIIERGPIRALTEEETELLNLATADLQARVPPSESR